MKQIAIKAFGLVGSFGISLFSFFHDINLLGVISGFSGCILTFALAYKEYQNARFLKEKRRGLEIDNDYTKNLNKKDENNDGKD